ncbi:hypothetical protein PoB_004219700 [Plakobranchus ocellatus]|uniref:Uncharacterized protein n=1 Tax=Plakobranchus ocellatus TaxID=259542 RepID=A0AAV4B990_9GAST|nr:hypothetical protein PoB_004219700 [Plakobranchus ocellatus]
MPTICVRTSAKCPTMDGPDWTKKFTEGQRFLAYPVLSFTWDILHDSAGIRKNNKWIEAIDDDDDDDGDDDHDDDDDDDHDDDDDDDNENKSNNDEDEKMIADRVSKNIVGPKH